MSDFDAVHAGLRAMMLAAADGLVVTRDLPGDLEVRLPGVDPKTGQAGWFGTVTTKKSYVAYHLMPIYADPTLADELTPALVKRRQGKTCFNFRSVDLDLFAELAALTRAARAAA